LVYYYTVQAYVHVDGSLS